jgi:hypothetical protein
MGYNEQTNPRRKPMTLSLGRLIAIATVLSIFLITGIFAMDVYANLQDIGQQYSTAS